MAEPDPDKTSRQMAEMTSAVHENTYAIHFIHSAVSPNIMPGVGVGEVGADISEVAGGEHALVNLVCEEMDDQNQKLLATA